MGKSSRIGRMGLSKAARLNIKVQNATKVTKAVKTAKVVAKGNDVEMDSIEPKNTQRKTAGGKEERKNVAGKNTKKEYVTEGMVDYITLMKSGKNDAGLRKGNLLRRNASE